MQWIDDAIILSARKFGENKGLLRVFAKSHGVFAGIVRGFSSKTNRGIFQVGNAVHVTWTARLSEQMGTFKIEPVKPFSAFVLQDKLKLAALSSACALMETSLPERHPYPRLYGSFYTFLEMLCDSSPHRGEAGRRELFGDSFPTQGPPPNLPLTGRGTWQESYVKLELEILAESGFGLDLEHCAATGTSDNLVYVSPKSGRAVSQAAGEPYKEKLLRLPLFLSSPWKGEDKGGGQNPPDNIDPTPDAHSHRALPGVGISDGLKLTGYFLEQRLAEPHGKKLPAARARLFELLHEETKEKEFC